MKRKTLVIAGAAGVLALGLAVPATVALAEPAPEPTTTGSSAPRDPQQRRDEHRAQLAEALAKELGIDQEKVAAALEKVETQLETDRNAERLAALKARLDQAVKDGKLTQEQADAILKAAEAGVFPGGGHGPGRGHHGPR